MPKEFNRTARVADLIQRELAVLIQREIKDPRIGMITISAVEISRDLMHAKIFVTVLNSEDIKLSMETLNGAASFLRGLLSKRIALRVTPQLRFVYDELLMKANKLSALIDKAIEEDKKDET